MERNCHATFELYTTRNQTNRDDVFPPPPYSQKTITSAKQADNTCWSIQYVWQVLLTKLAIQQGKVYQTTGSSVFRHGRNGNDTRAIVLNQNRVKKRGLVYHLFNNRDIHQGIIVWSYSWNKQQEYIDYYIIGYKTIDEDIVVFWNSGALFYKSTSK